MNSIKTAIENVKKIYMSDSNLNVLLDFERVLDELDLYAFRHWFKGELVEGPIVEKYWITCTFMWPEKMMPDPSGAERLLPYGCSVKYKKTSVSIPVKITSPDDFRDTASKKGKLVSTKVWLVSITMPQELVADIEQGSLEVAGEEFDMEDIQSAYQQEVDQSSVVKQDAGLGDVSMDQSNATPDESFEEDLSDLGI